MAEKRDKLFAPLPVENIMERMFSDSPIEQRLRESRIWVVWDEAVGKNIAAKARPETFRDGVLTVAVCAAPWLQQLNFMKRDIVAAVNRAVGTPLVNDIFLKAGNPAKPCKNQVREKIPTRPLSQDELRLTEEIAAEAGNAELQEAILSLIRKDRSHSPR
jgi:hypothetical protein